MGAGKSTIGKNLAIDIGYKFIDLDLYLEDKFGITVTEIFAKIGESGFRNEEYIVLNKIITERSNDLSRSNESILPNKHGLVIALGGGTITNPKCAKIIKEKTFCIYLNCTKELLMKRLLKNNSKRPLIAGKSWQELDVFIANLMIQREPIYKDCSKYICNIGPANTLPETISRITENIK